MTILDICRQISSKMGSRKINDGNKGRIHHQTTNPCSSTNLKAQTQEILCLPLLYLKSALSLFRKQFSIIENLKLKEADRPKITAFIFKIIWVIIPPDPLEECTFSTLAQWCAFCHTPPTFQYPTTLLSLLICCTFA